MKDYDVQKSVPYLNKITRASTNGMAQNEEILEKLISLISTLLFGYIERNIKTKMQLDAEESTPASDMIY